MYTEKKRYTCIYHKKREKEEQKKKVGEMRENDGVIKERGKGNRASSRVKYQQNILKKSS